MKTKTIQIGPLGIIKNDIDLKENVEHAVEFADDFSDVEQWAFAFETGEDECPWGVARDNYNHTDSEHLGDFKIQADAEAFAEKENERVFNEVAATFPKIEVPVDTLIEFGDVERGKYPQSRTVSIEVNGNCEVLCWSARGVGDTHLPLVKLTDKVKEMI